MRMTILLSTGPVAGLETLNLQTATPIPCHLLSLQRRVAATYEFATLTSRWHLPQD